ncbi:PR domain zinc finger protein 5-like [Contarinia nasturtii]|uniref:PR domain zinc finger protein 5-like n=1 Tax=Contarinia nasturtii TaxID=265458 RepID=UPI0012D3B13E|nr:PR domain zinc finger protein 5-like [Contarinia nasturtii]
MRTVHQCLFCPQTFGSASEKDDHILQHFAQETCIECDQHLIRIGSNLYTKHNAVTCIKVNIKTEEPICQEDQHETIDEKRDENGFTAVKSLTIETKPDLIALNEQLMLADENNLVENCEYELDSIDTSGAVSESTTNNENESNECNMCGKVLSSKDGLKKHVLITHSAPGHFPCEICPNVTLTRKDSLRKHMKMKHDPNRVKFKCNYCPSVFLKEISLEAHLSKCKRRTEILESGDSGTTIETVNTFQIKEEQIDDEHENSENTVCMETVEMEPGQQNEHSPVKIINEFNSNENNDREKGRQPNGDDKKCDICHKTFFDKNTVRRHKVLVHGETSGTHECSKCKIKFFSAKGLARHELKCTKDVAESLECKVCKMVFETKSSLTRHITHAHSEVKKFRCTTCGCISTNKVTFENHKCGRNITNPTASAMNRQNTIGKFVCDNCGKTIGSKIALRKHKIRFHSAEGTHVCACTKMFGTAEALAEHKAKCEFRKKSRFPLIHRGKTFECHLCHRVIKDIISFRRHMRRIHVPCKKKYECETCGKRYVHPFLLRNHNESVHLKIRKSLCTICGKSFLTEQTLRIHTYKHTGETPYECPLCEKAFSNPTVRDMHIRTHKEERNFKCPYEGCDKRFKTPANVYTHKKKMHGYEKKKPQL